MSHVKGSPDVVGACAKALLAAQRAAIVVHEIAKELPACRHLVALDSLALCHPTGKHPHSGNLSLIMLRYPYLASCSAAIYFGLFASFAHKACAKASILGMGRVRYNLGDILVRNAVLHRCAVQWQARTQWLDIQVIHKARDNV